MDIAIAVRNVDMVFRNMTSPDLVNLANQSDVQVHLDDLHIQALKFQVGLDLNPFSHHFLLVFGSMYAAARLLTTTTAAYGSMCVPHGTFSAIKQQMILCMCLAGACS